MLGRRVAVKVLHPHLADETSFRQRFRTEGIAAAKLVHPNVVAIYDTCVDDGTDAIVMELVRGRTLRAFLDSRGRLDTVEVAHLGVEVAQALSCAHRAGLVHRDIKPANILLADDGRVLVADFGIAKVLDDPDITTTSTMLGTVKYLAPEQVEGNPVDARSDVYALGAVLYECLCGVPPFVGETPAATALARLSQDPPPPSVRTPGVDPELDAVLSRALARDPARRHQSAAELRAALLHAATPTGADVTTTLPITSPPSSSPAPPSHVDPPSAPRRRWRASSIAVVLLVLVAVVVAALLVATTSTSRDLLSDDPAPPAPATGTRRSPSAAAPTSRHRRRGAGRVRRTPSCRCGSPTSVRDPTTGRPSPSSPSSAERGPRVGRSPPRSGLASGSMDTPGQDDVEESGERVSPASGPGPSTPLPSSARRSTEPDVVSPREPSSTDPGGTRPPPRRSASAAATGRLRPPTPSSISSAPFARRPRGPSPRSPGASSSGPSSPSWPSWSRSWP